MLLLRRYSAESACVDITSKRCQTHLAVPVNW